MFGNDEKVKWYTEIYAPRHYPVELVSGENFWFYKEDQRSGLGFYTYAGGGW